MRSGNDVVLSQFHYVLSETSIKMVNHDVLEIYDRLIGETTNLVENAISHVLSISYLMEGTDICQQEFIILDPFRASRAPVISLNPELAKQVSLVQAILSR